ncbi:MAG: hypothetical protein HQ518_04015 [Rhodopirellula sp.]|nr:hypothetical protein [Rhodopirellula sp.]
MAEPQAEAMRQMIADLTAIALIPEASITRISEALKTQTGFLSDSAMTSLIIEAVEDDDQGEAVLRALQSLEPESLDQVIAVVDRWRRATGDAANRFPDDQFEGLKRRLPILIQHYPVLARSMKAARLRNIIGNEFQGAAFICDARPVYNEGRDQIEGMVPVTTLKLVYEQQNLQSQEVEITLTSSELRYLIEQAEKAERKLQTLKESIGNWIPGSSVAGEVE